MLPLLHSRAPYRPGVGSFLSEQGRIRALSFRAGTKWHHPWWTQAQWNPSLQQWTGTVLAGFVNGLSPVFRATVQEQKGLGNPWENNPLNGKPFFSASVFEQPTQSEESGTIDIPLYLNPNLPLSFYALGFDGDGSKAVPQFFLNLGVANAPQQPGIDDLLAGTATLDLSPPTPPNLRLLRACDLWVHQPRVALTSSVEQNLAGFITGQPSVVQTLGVALPDPADRLQVIVGEFIADTQQIDPLSNDYEEPSFDHILISTVFLLSPPNTAAGSVPDGSWQPYVRHNLFRNLNWAQPSLTYAQQAASNAASAGNLASAVSGLGLGAGTLIISSFESQLSNAEQQALNIIEAASLAGIFWTPTGASSEITPPPAPASPKLGMNIYQNAAIKAAAAQNAIASQTLDPAFPYGGQQFKPNFFQSS